MGAIPSSSTHSRHETAQAKYGAGGDDDADRELAQAPATLLDDDYEPVGRDGKTIPSDANPTLPRVYSIPYEESSAGLEKPGPVYTVASLNELPEDGQAGPPVYTMATLEYQPGGDYTQIYAQQPH